MNKMKKYSKKEQYNILCQSAILVNDEGSFRIDYVPEYDVLLNGDDSIVLSNESDGEDYYYDLDEIDLNDPSTNTYRLVLSNPIVE
jgi:hypothetical protein